MIKKTLAIILALLMVLAVFAGCGKKNAGSPLGANSGDEAESSVETSGVDESTSVDADETTTNGGGGNEGSGDDTTAGDSEGGDSDDDEPLGPGDLNVDETSRFDGMSIEDLLNPDNFEGADIEDSVDFGGYTFKMLVDSTNFNKEFIAESDGELIKDALVNRQDYIEEYLGIDFLFDEQTGGYNNMQGFADFIATASGAGTPYDMALAYNLIPPVVAAQGLSKDLAESDNLKLLTTKKEYWGQTFRDEVQIQKRIFWMSDNSSWNNIRNMLCIYVNTEMFETHNEGKTLADLYKMVREGAWTMENLLALIENTWVDDGSGAADDNDTFGLQAAESTAWLDTWLYAAGFKHTKKNATTGLYEWTHNDQPVIDFINWWQKTLHDNQNIDKQDSTQYKMFLDGRAMFAVATVGMTEQKGLELEFTVLPMPMYKSSVKNGYSTPFSNTYSSFLIPKAAGKTEFERSATVLELLAAEGNRRLAPTYFEIYLKRQNAGDDPDMQAMFNIIRNSIVFDLGYLYGSTLTVEDTKGAKAELFVMLRRTWAGDGTGEYENFSTVWARVKSTATAKLDSLMIDIVDY